MSARSADVPVGKVARLFRQTQSRAYARLFLVSVTLQLFAGGMKKYHNNTKIPPDLQMTDKEAITNLCRMYEKE